MSAGDDELWGDYLIDIDCGTLTFINSAPDFNIDVLIAVVPLDDVGQGWVDPGVTSCSPVFLKVNFLTHVQSGFSYHTVPFDPNIPNQSGWSGPLAVGATKTQRKVIILDKIRLTKPNSTKAIQFSYQVCNGSAGWFAFVILARKLAVPPP
jgi:hypothetical protein